MDVNYVFLDADSRSRGLSSLVVKMEGWFDVDSIAKAIRFVSLCRQKKKDEEIINYGGA